MFHKNLTFLFEFSNQTIEKALLGANHILSPRGSSVADLLLLLTPGCSKFARKLKPIPLSIRKQSTKTVPMLSLHLLLI